MAMDAIENLLSRGVDKIYPTREELEKVLRSGKKLKLYQGFDPTGDRLHIGHMVGFRKHRQWQDLGHEVIFLVGDGTGQAGDPTDKKKTRDHFFTRDELRNNAKTYLEQAAKIVRFDGPNPIKVLYNSDWLNELKLVDILNLAGHFSVQQMLERDMYQERLKVNESINLREFLYPLLQGYDSVAMDVDLEIGGTDQTFNMLAGRQLLKAYKGKDKFVMTLPMLADSSGKKIGKSEGNVIGLTDPPAELFGKIMSLGDDAIVPLFTLLTDTPLVEIDTISAQLKSGANPISFKKQAAKLIVAQLHNEQLADSAEKHFESTIQNKTLPSDIPSYVLSDPSDLSVLSVLVGSNLAPSLSAGRRLIDQGGVKVDGQKVTNYQQMVNNNSTVSVGNRNFVRVVVKS
jgi:tyrosyl-tRNA synthetase